MAEILSQDEIMKLLEAVDAADAADKEASGDYSTERPDKFSREQLREISIIHEKFARNAANSLSNKLRKPFKMKVASIDQLYLGEFYRSIPVPTTLGVINMDPLNGSIILEIDPSISFAIIDKICNSSIVATKAWRELTPNDKFILKGMYNNLIEDLRDAWYEIIVLRPRFEKIETDPKFIRLAPPMEWVALVTLEAKMDDVEGMLNFCIPYPVIEPVLEKLTV
jgi:flagellar motor switch protein FliM